jgi:hypothetical protein
MILTVALWDRIRQNIMDWGPGFMGEDGTTGHTGHSLSLWHVHLLSCMLGLVTSTVGFILGIRALREARAGRVYALFGIGASILCICLARPHSVAFGLPEVLSGCGFL